MALTMASFSRLGTLAACVIATACGGSANVDEIEGSGAAGGAAGSNAGGTAGNTADGSGSDGSTGGDDGGTGGGSDAGGAGGGSDAGGAGGGSDDAAGGTAGSAGSDAGEPLDILLADDFEDGNTNDWYRACATFKALPEAAADETGFGARLTETREEGCEQGYAGLEVPSPQTPSRVDWWMRSNSRGEIFGSFQIHQAIMVYAADGMVVVYDGDKSKIFDIDGSQWHHYELHDIDWTNHTYSLSVDGSVQATSFGFNQPKDVAEAIYVLAAARDMSTTAPVSVDVDEIVLYE